MMIDVEFKKSGTSRLDAMTVRLVERTRGDALQLRFENNRARVRVEARLKHELYWEIFGLGGDTLSVKTLYDGVENTILNKAKIPSGKSQHRGVQFFSVGGGAS